jgi:hypothetical protein
MLAISSALVGLVSNGECEKSGLKKKIKMKKKENKIK